MLGGRQGKPLSGEGRGQGAGTGDGGLAWAALSPAVFTYRNRGEGSLGGSVG